MKSRRVHKCFKYVVKEIDLVLSVSFPSKERIRQIKMDAERLKQFKINPLELASELIDFVISVQLENLRKKYPHATDKELYKILQKQIVEFDEKWKNVSKTFLKEQ